MVSFGTEEEEEDPRADNQAATPQSRDGRVWQPAALGEVGAGGVRAPRDAVAPELSLQRVPEEVEQRDTAPHESPDGTNNLEALLRQLEEEERNVERAAEALAAAERERIRLRELKEAELSAIRADTQALEAESVAYARLREMIREAQQDSDEGHEL